MEVKEGITMKESDHGKWVRLAVVRLNRFKDTMLLISNLSDSRYDYSEREVNWYFGEINKRMELVKNEFFHSRSRKSSVTVEEIKPQTAEFSSDMNERFHRLMVIRVNRIVTIFNLLLNLSNRSHYQFYSGEVKQAFEYMKKVSDTTLSHFIGIGDFSFEKQDDGEEDERRR
jgi:hypothetical protein